MLSRVPIRLFVSVFTLTLVLVAACASSKGDVELDDGAASAAGRPVAAGGGIYYDVSPQELSSMLESKDFLLVNVHVPNEGEIQDTDLFIPYDQIGDRLEELPSQPNAKIVLYCRSGSMSATAANTLVRLGYTNIWNLDGGMIAWEAAGYPLINAQF